MEMKCPRCGCETVLTLTPGEQACSETGAVIGAVSSIVSVIKAARFNPAASIASVITGVLISGTAGYFGGRSTGEIIGSTLDSTFLNNRQCFQCKKKFHIDET